VLLAQLLLRDRLALDLEQAIQQVWLCVGIAIAVFGLVLVEQRIDELRARPAGM
jgi:hypothetical protein